MAERVRMINLKDLKEKSLGDLLLKMSPKARRRAHMITYLPTRTHTRGKGPPTTLGNGMVAINLPDRRMWIGVHDEIVEVRDLDHLLECWTKVLDDEAPK